MADLSPETKPSAHLFTQLGLIRGDSEDRTSVVEWRQTYTV